MPTPDGTNSVPDTDANVNAEGIPPATPTHAHGSPMASPSRSKSSNSPPKVSPKPSPKVGRKPNRSSSAEGQSSGSPARSNNSLTNSRGMLDTVYSDVVSTLCVGTLGRCKNVHVIVTDLSHNPPLVSEDGHIPAPSDHEHAQQLSSASLSKSLPTSGVDCAMETFNSQDVRLH